MAITSNTYTGNGSNKLFSITFPYLDTSDIDVYLNNVLQTITTQYSFANATTIEFVTAPPNGAAVKIDRTTDDSELSATFFPGSSIKAADLNDNFDQTLYVVQEINNKAVKVDDPLYANKTYIDAQDATKVNKSGDTMSGNLVMGGNRVTGLGTPSVDADSATKLYVDQRYGELGVPGLTRWRKLATAGQTVFSGVGDDGNTLAYSASRESVFVNGAYQQRGVDYTADNGTSITITPALLVGDVVDVHCVNNAAGVATDQASGVYFTQSGTGATVRTVDSKLKDVVSVKDFGAVGDGVANDTAAIQAAITYADSTNNTLYFPPGNYITTVALRLNGGITVKGSGLATTTITRTNLTAETIDGQPFTTIFYVTGGWNHISDLSITGVAGTISGVTFGVNIAAKGSIKNVAINNCLYGITEVAGVFLYEFNNIQAVNCGYGFWFNSTDQKTSLTFNQCYAANTGPAYRLRQTNYSVMNSCAADNCNWGATPGNPYGTGFGLPTSGEGVYHFIQSDVVLNSPGAEGSYGNGVISTESSIITINSMFSYDCRSEFVPNYGAYPNYAVGPIQCGTAANRLTINNANNSLWTNTAVSTGYPTKPIAAVVAFNYNEATLGVDPALQVILANVSKLESAGAIKGMGPIGRNCANLAAVTKAPVAAATMSGSQVPTAFAFTKVNFDTKEYDTDVCYSTANKRFTPTVAGFYNVNAAVQVRYTGGAPDGGLSVFKNGTQYKEGSNFTTGAIANFGCSSLVYLNGTTDYVEIYFFTTHASAVVFPQTQWSYFQISPTRTA